MEAQDNLKQLYSSEPELEAIASLVRQAAEQRRGDGLALLSLLRLLDSLHRQIRDDFFQESLPDNRQALYSLLKDIEAEGGWPYIPRMRLQSFINELSSKVPQTPNSLEHEDSLNR
jgi:hypothetical protein